MLYTLNLDSDNYILSIAHTKNDSVELDLESMELAYMNAYKYIDGVLSLDEEKKAELIAQEEAEEKQIQIAELLEQLHSSDEDLLAFIEDLFSFKNPLTFISDMIGLMKNYATLVANRQSIREQIKELSK